MSTQAHGPKAEGLEGVVVAATELSHVDGLAGRLVLRGFSIEDVAGRRCFEDIVGLLSDGAPPDEARSAALRASLGSARVAAFAELDRLGDALSRPDAMAALRTALSHQRDAEDPMALLGRASVVAAAWARRQRGKEPIAPREESGHAADLLHMLGREANPAEASGLDTYLVTVADHGLNASTFTARVVASTGSDRVSAVTAAVGALKGPLHGGAPGPVLDMLDAVGSPERARPWLLAEIEAGRRIMGMGHRIYRVRDPRAAVLERAIEGLRQRAGGPVAERLALSRAVEAEAEKLLTERHPERPLKANVEFYTAVLLEAVGVPRELFSTTFACARIAGWSAHIDEQRRVGKLIRPASTYVGPAPDEPLGR